MLKTIATTGVMALAMAALAPLAFAKGNSWGSLAYSPATHHYGQSHDFDDQGEADSRALEACMESGADDCKTMVSYNNACGAVEAGATGYGTAWDADEQAAQQRALSACYDHANDCALVISACSPGGGQEAD